MQTVGQPVPSAVEVAAATTEVARAVRAATEPGATLVQVAVEVDLPTPVAAELHRQVSQRGEVPVVDPL